MEDLLNERAFLDGGERDYFLTDPIEEESSFSAFATDFLLEEAIAAGFIAAEEGVLGVDGAPSRGYKLEEVVLADDFGVQFSRLGSLALPRVLPYDQVSGLTRHRRHHSAASSVTSVRSRDSRTPDNTKQSTPRQPGAPSGTTLQPGLRGPLDILAKYF